MKISVIGIGKVGSTVAFVLAKDGLANELVLYNRTPAIAHADAIDIQHAVAFVPHQVTVRDGNLDQTANSDVLVICVGVPMARDIHDRGVVLEGNTRLMCELIPELVRRSPKAIIVNATNPLDAITYHILTLSGFPWNRVIGTGTLIDSARFRELLGQQVGIHPLDLNAYIMGEHGDTQFAALSIATSGGEHIDATPVRQQMIEEAKQSAWDVFAVKGYTNYAVAMAVQLIVQAIVKDLRYTMPVSALIDGFCDVHDVCLSVPCVIGRNEVHLRLSPNLSADERARFCRSAVVVREMIEKSAGIVAAAKKANSKL